MRRRGRRISIRLLGAVIGLVLGWTAAGFWQEASFARDSADVPHAAGNDAGEHAPGDVEAARALVPQDEGEPTTPGWFTYVVGGVLGLFIAAILIGQLTRIMNMRDPNIAAAEADKAEHAEH